MICQTIRSGNDCAFMTKKGCGYNGGSCHPIVEACASCNKIIAYNGGEYCRVYPAPQSKWATGKCPTASHVKIEPQEASQKVNPLKASKRAAGKK